MLCSDRFLQFHACRDASLLSRLLCSAPALLAFIRRVSFFEANYGFLWFQSQCFLHSPLKEVLHQCLAAVAMDVATHAEAYYEAMLGKREKRVGRMVVAAVRACYLRASQDPSRQLVSHVKTLYGAHQMDL